MTPVKGTCDDCSKERNLYPYFIGHDTEFPRIRYACTNCRPMVDAASSFKDIGIMLQTRDYHFNVS